LVIFQLLGKRIYQEYLFNFLERKEEFKTGKKEKAILRFPNTGGWFGWNLKIFR